MRALLRAAFVIARRDFTAVIFSQSFILFLIVPIFPLAIGAAGGWVGGQMAHEGARPAVGVILPAAQADALDAARARLGQQMDASSLPDLRHYPADSDPQALLAQKDSPIRATLSGSLQKPLLSGNAGDVAGMKDDIALLTSVALAGSALPVTTLNTHMTAQSTGSEQESRLATGRGAQTLLFLLTVVLAGMVLSNMVEEKTNKIIEILAAAVPIDAIFLGKLMAMLGMSFIGISVWGSCALIANGLMPSGGAALTTPAVGWPVFVLLGFVYFSTAYTLLGSLFIGIGAQANTVREVQTLSMPITMCQVPIFLFTTYASSKMGETPEIIATIFPFSSPFAMIARAAQSDAILPHLLAIAWQLLWVAVIIRVGVRLFRRNVLKSGQQKAKRGVFSRRRASVPPEGS